MLTKHKWSTTCVKQICRYAVYTLLCGIVLVVKSQKDKNFFRIMIGNSVGEWLPFTVLKLKSILMQMRDSMNWVQVTKG
jgi:hypothetical protein